MGYAHKIPKCLLCVQSSENKFSFLHTDSIMYRYLTDKVFILNGPESDLYTHKDCVTSEYKIFPSTQENVGHRILKIFFRVKQLNFRLFPDKLYNFATEQCLMAKQNKNFYPKMLCRYSGNKQNSNNNDKNYNLSRLKAIPVFPLFPF